jgi:hypothetical protein
MAPDAEIHFERIGVTQDQIDRWALPSRPTKQSDTRARNFGAVSVELDSIPPNRLRTLVQFAIERHLPRKQLTVLIEAENSERLILGDIIGRLTRTAADSEVPQ